MTRTQRAVIWVTAFTVFIVVVHLLKPILLPFIVGFGIAYLLDPIADRLEARGLSRVLATVLITGAFFVLLTGIVIMIAPLLQAQIVEISERIPEFITLLQQIATEMIARLRAMLPAEALDTSGGVSGDVAGAIGGALKNLVARLWAGGIALFEVLSLIIITPIVSFYMILKWDEVVGHIDRLLPRDSAETIRMQVREIDRTLSGFVRGQAGVCVSLGVFYATMLSIIGLEGGLLIGLAAGAISFVPYVGSLTGIVVALGVAFVQLGDLALIAAVAVVFVVGQVLESYILTPRLVGNRVGLHDLWIIFAVMAGGSLFGFVGVLLAVPTAAVIGVLVRFTIERYRESQLYLGGSDRKPPSLS